MNYTRLFAIAIASIKLLSANPLAQERRDVSGAVPQNVLIIVADDIGIDRVGAYGYTGPSGAPIAPRTKNIDGLAREGVLFRNAWAHPLCSPTRAAALTGRYPNRVGVGYVVAGTSPEVGLNADQVTLGDTLPPFYLSAVVGKWHLADNGPFGSLTGGIDHAPRCGFRVHYGSFANLIRGGQSYFRWNRIRARLGNLQATKVSTITQYATTRTTTDALGAVNAFGSSPWLI